LIGRFITKDPLGQSDGPNLYLYCNNDPVNKNDPWGLKSCDTDENKIRKDIEKLKKEIDDSKKLLEAIKEYLKNKSIWFSVQPGTYNVNGYTIVVKEPGGWGEITLDDNMSVESIKAGDFTVKDYIFNSIDVDVSYFYYDVENGSYSIEGSVWGYSFTKQGEFK